MLRRLVQNLVSNAIKYTAKGKVLVGVRKRGNEAWIHVYDTGIGIPASKFKVVFKEFARLDEGARTAAGLGLGLSIVDRISRVVNHPVTLQSTPGRGTVFRVRLPLEQAGSAPVVTEATRSNPVPGTKLDGLKVLCIDNEPAIIDGMRLLLSGWGCEVETASGVGDCEGVIRRGWRPDAVIADYHLDDGNGITAIARLRGTFGPVAAALVTADRTPDVRAHADRDGIVMLNKPVKPAALRATLARIAGAVRQNSTQGTV
jgi:CheY-like chemotaxis protein